MDCKRAKTLVTKYIRDELSQAEIEDFLSHIRTCQSCEEELEIYYMIEKGLNNIDDKKSDFNLSISLHEYIANSYRKINRLKVAEIVYYTVTTLLVISVILSVALQFRIWWR